MVSGLVFDIQRCALHDGPGIRSVAFLKGCPLRCLWCCNPESQSAERQLFYHSGKCLSCFGCVGVCPAGALRAGTEGVEIDFGLCVSCGKCGKICPAGAIGLYGYEMTAEEVVVEFERDAGYYASSGGGITLSGGEPLMQAEFASEILMLSKKKGWHTAVETCGAVPAGYLSAVLPFADLFLLDFKLSDRELFKKYAGGDYDMMMNFLEVLAASGKEVILRTVFVPGVNDTANHAEAVAALCRKYPCIAAVDVMPLHDYGKTKYTDIGRPVPEIYGNLPNEGQVDRWLSLLREAGIENVKKG